MQAIDTAVLVIGAGPAGARTAEKLATKGIDVSVIEKDQFAGKTNVCGGSIDAAFVKELEIPSSIVKIITKWIYHFPFKEVEVEIENLSFARCNFDKYLADRAVSHGAKLLTSTIATQVRRDETGVEVMTVDRNSGEKKLLRSNLVVFADGPSTLAQKFFGIGFRGTRTNTAVGAIYEFEHDEGDEVYDLFFDKRISPWGYGWIFPKSDHLNVGVGCLVARIDAPMKEHLDYFVYKHPVVSRRLEGRRKLRFAAAAIPFGPVEKISDTRILVVGDAAGMVDSIWGGGIGFGLKAADLVASVVSEALARNRFDKSFLAQYDALWEKSKMYDVLRKFKILSDMALRLDGVYKNVYPRLVQLVLWRLMALRKSQNHTRRH